VDIGLSVTTTQAHGEIAHCCQQPIKYWRTAENSLFQTKDDNFHVAVAKTLDQACKLLEVGFEYIATWMMPRSSESENENTLPKRKSYYLRLYKGYLSIHYTK